MAVPAQRTEPTAPAPLRRWEPFGELEQLREQMDRLIEGTWSGNAGNGGAWLPVADVEETDDAWIVEAELPGVNKKDVNVELRDSELLITGELKERERTGIIRRRTRRTGRFEYRVKLPSKTDAEGVEAKLHDGVLTIRVPKSERATPRRIEVKAA